MNIRCYFEHNEVYVLTLKKANVSDENPAASVRMRKSAAEKEDGERSDKKTSMKPIRKRKLSNSSCVQIKDVSPSQENERRYPKRRERINYTEAEVPDDDHYLCKFLLYSQIISS